ncbi:MAG TPA: universal stress protein [Polyangiaceae bacterium]|nr:universal stress protein [Polyangiaceae bacterium]
MAFQRILVPVDYSEDSRAALAVAVDLARSLGATLDVVHVWDRPSYVSDTVLVGHGAEQRPLGELIRENAELEMKEFLDALNLPSGITRSSRLISGAPAAALLEELRTGNYDLVVMGTKGRTGFAHLLLGSVAEKLVRHSPVPVLTVPRKLAEQARAD